MSEKVKAGHQETDSGFIPADWVLSRIDSDASIKTGSKNTQDRIDGGTYPFYVRSQQVERINSYSHDGEAVLTAGDGVGTGKVFHYINGKFDVHQRVYQISDFSPRLNGRYFFYQFSTRFYDRIMSMTAKSSVDSVRMEMIAGMQIPLAPIHEQSAIAAALDDIDAMITGLDQLIAKKRDIQQAAMQQLLTGQRRLPGFSGEWGRLALGEMEQRQMVRLFRGNVISKKDIEAIPGDFPIYSSSVKENGLFGRYGHYMFDEELITWSVDGGGNFFYRPKHKFSVTNVCGYMRVLSPTVHCRFLAFQLQELHSKLSFDYTTKAHPSVIRGAYTLTLPDHTEQIAIAQTLSDMQNELASLEAQRDKVRLIKHGMMQELLTGRIRLSEAS